MTTYSMCMWCRVALLFVCTYIVTLCSYFQQSLAICTATHTWAEYRKQKFCFLMAVSVEQEHLQIPCPCTTGQAGANTFSYSFITRKKRLLQHCSYKMLTWSHPTKRTLGWKFVPVNVNMSIIGDWGTLLTYMYNQSVLYVNNGKEISR